MNCKPAERAQGRAALPAEQPGQTRVGAQRGRTTTQHPWGAAGHQVPQTEGQQHRLIQTSAVKVSSLSVCETHKQNTEHHRNAHEKINNSSFSESFGLY